MNRRTAIGYLIFLLGLTVPLLFVWKWWRMPRQVNLSQLNGQKELIGALAECIIPKTETPGAKDAQVEEFIIQMVKEGIDSREQHTFISGLDDLVVSCARKFKTSFVQCKSSEQYELLVKMQNEAGFSQIGLIAKVRRMLFGRSFFEMLKEFTIIGYCTSEIGATLGLAYDHIPMCYQPCKPLAEGQRAWATK